MGRRPRRGWTVARGVGALSLACGVVLPRAAAVGPPRAVAFAPPARRAPTGASPPSPRGPGPSDPAAAASATRLCGIKKFRAWFAEEFPHAVRTVDAGKHPGTFDHVLVDTNSILHVVHRRSRSPEHAAKLLMLELDALVARCRPRRSLVLAVDGSPAAAKVAAQRKSRSATLRNALFKLRHSGKLRGGRRATERRRRTYKASLGVLHLTPGTARMATLEATLLYWAWQRLQHMGRRRGAARAWLPPGAEVWISPSTAPGEGEVKLLGWIRRARPRLARAPGQSIALVGSDADLLLGAMVGVPPAWTHNVFVLRLDEGDGRAREGGARRDVVHCASVWELTRGLDAYCREHVPCYRPERRPRDQNLLLQMRADLVLLFVLNGNDYLPRVVGVDLPGALRNYLRLLREWIARGRSTAGVGLICPDTLRFRSAFCAEYFRSFRNAPTEQERLRSIQKQNTTWTPFLSRLNDLTKMGFIPPPIRFHLPGDDQGDNTHGNDLGGDDSEGHDNNDGGSSFKSSMQVMRLSVGEKSEGDWHECSILVNVTRPLVKARSALSRKMLKEFDLLESTDSSCDWEIDVSAPANVERYLAGLVWTLQTYQDGVCPTYHYNYGKCLAPLGDQIATYFVDAMNENRTVGAAELLSDFKPGGSISAGMACLAALPVSLKHLVPEPYSLIQDEDIEKFWAQSMDPVDNFFQMEKFETLVNAAVDKLVTQAGEESVEGRRIKVTKDDSDPRGLTLGDHHWTVLRRTKEPLKRSFRPPPPPVENLSWLRGNKKIKASRIVNMDLPSPLKATIDTRSGSLESNCTHLLQVSTDHTNFISFLNGSAVAQMPYKFAFESAPDMH